MSSSTTSSRPRFEPTACSSEELPVFPLDSYEADTIWIPLISCPANFPEELFDIAVSQLIHHPEYNSTLILRSDTISDITSSDVHDPIDLFPSLVPRLKGLRRNRCIHRKLLPRRPGRDASLEQYCTLYTSVLDADSETRDVASNNTLVLTPITSNDSPLPYYHPRVSHLAFRYISTTERTKEISEHGTPSGPASLESGCDYGTIRIEVVPLPDTPLDQSSRLYRTCLALLDTLHRYGWGAMTNYRKRVVHDVLIPREQYQDLYLVMRERHKGLVDTWQEVTDPLKHVFEDIGIATYLMLLWRVTFGNSLDSLKLEDGEPWQSWPRPPGGFLDLGCGNGLLTHILTSEGYEGHGIDVRARTSWKSYPESTQSHLHVHAFNPLTSEDKSGFFPLGVFIIANHADELTPWTPVLSTLYSASGYLSIPCCAWEFDGRYERSAAKVFALPSGRVSQTVDEFATTLNLGGDGSNTSGYSMYRIWLASLSVHCGWEVECETLRIPSTRNWAIVGRKRHSDVTCAQAMENIESIIRNVRERAVFKPRKPEGKADGH